jgi:serine/threonine-protein kinase
MAPEQLLGETLDRRCDLFALGIVLYELATHQRLFKRASDYLSARAILEDPIPRADSVDPAVPAALADVIAKALERDRDKRYATAKDLARAIEGAIGRVATQDEIAAALAEWHGAELSALRTRQAKVLGSHVQTVPLVPAPRRRWWPLATAGVVVAGAGGWFALHARSQTAAPPPDGAPVVVQAPVDAAPPIDAAPPPDAPAMSLPPPPPSPVHKEPGLFSIESDPYATIYVDGHKLGVTPIIQHPLAAGRHRVRAVIADGRTKEQTLEVPAGKQAAPIHLRW